MKFEPGQCFVIAELGLNHNGSLNRAIAMVRSAAKAGANGIKVQAYTASEFLSGTETYTYKEPLPGSKSFRFITEMQSEMFKRCELKLEDFQAIRDECRKLKILFGATATDEKWVKAMVVLGADFLKVGSDDIVHLPLLRALKATGKPVILSTGMATEDEIAIAVEECKPTVLLHCVSQYPTPLMFANVARMESLRKFGVPTGYSDHTEGLAASIVAISRGAVMIEKHFTLDKSLPGPDHWFSADEEELQHICNTAKLVPILLGSGTIIPNKLEIDMRRIARRSIVAARSIPSGTVLSMEHLAFKRPGTGLSPALADGLIGRILEVDVIAGEQIKMEMFSKEKAN